MFRFRAFISRRRRRKINFYRNYYHFLYIVLDSDLCLSNPCQNGGTCEDGFQTYTCHCDELNVGSQCEYLLGSCDFDDLDLPMCYYEDDPAGW